MAAPSMEANEHSPLKKILRHVIAGALTALVLAVILGAAYLFNLGGVVDQLELKAYDLRAQMFWGQTHKRPSQDVVILQFDDPSLNVLNDEYGVWPWPRDVHAHMIHFLNKLGAKSILYDIMFVAHRKGSEDADAMLANAFKQYQNVYLSMNFDSDLAQSQKLGKDLKPRDIELLEPLSINLTSELGKQPSPFLHLQTKNGVVFFANDHMTFNHYRSIMPSLLSTGRNIGIINHGSDADGVSRSNPLFFRFEYQKFIKTDALPLTRRSDGWYDAQGNKTDEKGYLYAKTTYLPVHPQGNGTFLDSRPSFPNTCDKDGYLIDSFGQYVYKREWNPDGTPKYSYMYFPYLGLRAVLDLKFPKRTPEMLLTSDGHLKFEGYDIPLNSNGDFLVNWYNINVTREKIEKDLRELRDYRNLLDIRIQAQEKEAKTASHPELIRVQKDLEAKRNERNKALTMISILEKALEVEYRPQPYEMISAWEVIRTMKKEEAGLPLNDEDKNLKKKLHDKVIFVGATAVAAYDIKNTSIHSTMPGVVLQANLFDNLYQNDGHYMKRVDPNVNLLVTIFICVLAAGFTVRMRSVLAGLLTIANVAVLYTLAAIVLYHQANLWINIAMPLVSLVITTTMTFMVKYMLRDKDYKETYALATTDSMTGLYNHRFFQDHMRRSIEQANRFKHKYSLVLIDIDFFKKFNDTYGHQAGDEVLRHVARKLQKSVRNVDIVARYGGEEMAVILDRATEEEALIVAQKIVKAVAEEAYPIAEGVAKHVTISCGVATYPTHGTTPSELIEFADAGLYRAKENGRNQVGAQYDGEPPPTNDDENTDEDPGEGGEQAHVA